MIRLGLLGARGRMGSRVSALVAAEHGANAKVVASADRGDPLAPLLDTDVVIDFSTPAAMLALAQEAVSRDGTLPAFVVGSTGWTDEQRENLAKLGRRTAVLPCSNFSTGAQALLHLVREAAPLLKSLGYTPVIVERHHRHKKDAPSGTAVSLQRAFGSSPADAPQTHSVRAGEIIGDHEVSFYGQGEQLLLAHSAQDRSIFARGAISVALWLASNRGLRGVLGIEQFLQDSFVRR